MEIIISMFLLLVGIISGWMLAGIIRRFVRNIERPINFTCKLLGHDMRGPYPIGEPGEARFICFRCYKLMIIEVLSGNVTIHRSAKFMDDPLVYLIREAKKHEQL